MKELEKFTMVSHINPDVDLCACAWACKAKTVILIPANAKELPPDMPASVVVLDHDLGLKGDKKNCAFASFVKKEGIAVSPDLLEEINEQDTTGKVEKPRFSLAAILAALRKINTSDQECIALMGKILEGINSLWLDRTTALKIIQRGETVETKSGEKFLILKEETGPMVGIVANEQGFSGALYKNEESLGITRYPGRDIPDLTKIKKFVNEEGWFFHPQGFLACRGSRKAPATSPSKYSLEDIKGWVKKL